MRIALACPYAWDAPGGVQVHVGQLARRLALFGHEPLILAPASGPVTDPLVEVVGKPIPIPYNGSVAPIDPWPASARRVREVLGRFRPDVVHAHEPLTLSTAMFASRWEHAPVVATFHAYADRARLFTLIAPALRGTWRRIDIRVAVSEAAAEFVTARFSEDDVRIVPNGVEIEKFRGAEVADLPEGRKVLFVNRLDPRKGFPVMVRAFAHLAGAYSDLRLVVAGDGNDRSAVEELPPAVRERVVMLGNVPHDSLPPYHAACDIFAAPATGQESFGIVLVEAMAAGLPVVASDIPGYREVVRAGTDGLLVPPNDPRALAGAIGDLLDDPGKARGFAKAGPERAKRYSWTTVAREIEAIYREAIGES